jgi:pyridoxamine 5'-phosphate oxidase family protein
MAFTDAELDYLAGQPLGRVATAQPNGTLQVSPVGFRYNSRTNTIDVGGHGMARSRKFRNVADNGKVAFVVDDIASVDPWAVRGIEVRGEAEVLATGGKEIMPLFDDEQIRLRPRRIVSWGLDSEDAFNARSIK